jgi:uncharacterized DUF497 family protein
MLNFEWDIKKAQINIERHGISFKEASTIFADPLSDFFYDSDHSVDEDQYLAIGLSEFNNVLVVVFTEKDDIIRIISARKATKKERKHYEDGK